MEYNPPNTRERVEARRRTRKATRPAKPKAAARQRAQPKRAVGLWLSSSPQESRPSATARRAKKVVAASSQQAVRRWFVARQQSKTAPRQESGSQVRPGPKRALGQWLFSGRLFSLLLFVATMGTLVQLFISPDFNIQEVQVEGNTALDKAVVAELSGLKGLPIWFVDGDAVARRLLQNPYIEQAGLREALPNRAVITIVERRAEVRWQLNGIQYLVDSGGKVLDTAQQPPEDHTLVIMDSSPHNLQPNDQVDPDALRLARALALRLPTELQFTPATIGWDFALGVYVKSGGGQTIIFGRTDNLEQKLAVFNHLLKDNTAFTYLDLRPSNPFYQNNQRS